MFAISRTSLAQPSNDFRLHFHRGDLHHVVTTEILRLTMHFPQVEEHDAKPSIRTTIYCFTERVDSILSDGSALIAASLDSFRTGIMLGEGPHAENFFQFNSSGDWDITHELRDIKVLPRAQFLGQTLHFILRPDGTIAKFLDLAAYHEAAIGGGYDYDVLHAMLALSDSVRMGQLMEYGAAGLAALQTPYISPSTTTEIPVTRTVTAKRSASGTVDIHTQYSNAPSRIEYLEGIAMPLYILHYSGSGDGAVTLAKGYLKHSFFEDTAHVLLHVDIDTVPEEITRTVTTDIYPIATMHGRIVSVHEGLSGPDSLDNVGRSRQSGPPTRDDMHISPPTAPDASPANRDTSSTH